VCVCVCVCVRERLSLDMSTLVRRLHTENARQKDQPENPHDIDYRVIFSLDGAVLLCSFVLLMC
jgi:hypothetical protein